MCPPVPMTPPHQPCPPTSQAWERLEKAEHERELALRTELIRQEKLEQLGRPLRPQSGHAGDLA